VILVRKLLLPAVAAIVFGVAVPARAQIYTWRDANGNMVLSDIPQGGDRKKSYAVANTEGVRATRFVSAARTADYDDLIREHARLNSVRPDLVRAVIQVESAYNPYARSPKGALGLMQLMPSTAQLFGVRNPFNPVENVRAGVAYLRQLLDRYNDNEELALAAYNAGPGAVDKHGQNVPPYKETRNYVARVNDIAGAARRQRLRNDIQKSSEVVDGREVPLYCSPCPPRRAPGSEPAADE
jgi:soluble lytic murein transglycosylase-like protein